MVKGHYFSELLKENYKLKMKGYTDSTKNLAEFLSTVFTEVEGTSRWDEERDFYMEQLEECGLHGLIRVSLRSTSCITITYGAVQRYIYFGSKTVVDVLIALDAALQKVIEKYPQITLPSTVEHFMLAAGFNADTEDMYTLTGKNKQGLDMAARVYKDLVVIADEHGVVYSKLATGYVAAQRIADLKARLLQEMHDCTERMEAIPKLKYMYKITLSAEGCQEGFVFLTKEEAKLVNMVVDPDNWCITRNEAYAGSCCIDVDNPMEIVPEMERFCSGLQEGDITCG